MINKLISKYSISKSFYNRYFKQNAENRLAMNQLEFMLWRRGRFIKPQEKEALLEGFIAEEIENFYTQNEINIPQLQFAVTTRCSLKCRDCNALIPEFGNEEHKHIDLNFDDFKHDFDSLMGNVTSIRRFMLLGGEPLLNKNLPDIVDYCAGNKGIKTIEIITNGTILPSSPLMEMVKKHGDKVYFHLSNYSENEKLKKVLKYDEIINLLKQSNIKHQMSMNLTWNTEETLSYREYTNMQLQAMFDNCWLKRCVQALNGTLSLCPRLSSGLALKYIANDYNEHINIRTCGDTNNFKNRLMDFYQKDCFESCRYCVRIDEQISPAIQL